VCYPHVIALAQPTIQQYSPTITVAPPRATATRGAARTLIRPTKSGKGAGVEGYDFWRRRQVNGRPPPSAPQRSPPSTRQGRGAPSPRPGRRCRRWLPDGVVDMRTTSPSGRAATSNVEVERHCATSARSMVSTPTTAASGVRGRAPLLHGGLQVDLRPMFVVICLMSSQCAPSGIVNRWFSAVGEPHRTRDDIVARAACSLIPHVTDPLRNTNGNVAHVITCIDQPAQQRRGTSAMLGCVAHTRRAGPLPPILSVGPTGRSTYPSLAGGWDHRSAASGNCLAMSIGSASWHGWRRGRWQAATLLGVRRPLRIAAAAAAGVSSSHRHRFHGLVHQACPAGGRS